MNYKDIFENEAIITGVFSVVLFVFQWIINTHNLKKKNKELGYWMKNWERKKSFSDKALKMYLVIMIIFIICEVLKIVLLIKINERIADVLSGSIYYGSSIFYVYRKYKKLDRDGELWSERKKKIEVITILYMAFGITFWMEKFEVGAGAIEVLTVAMLLYFGVTTISLHETICVLDKQNADIYTNNGDIIELIEAGNIKKRGEWIVVYKTSCKGVEEIRIKESEIIRINYYGNPLITYDPLFKRKEKVK